MNRRKFMMGGLLFIISSGLSKSISITPIKSDISLKDALYINCLQRTQTQQLFKDYLMIGLGSNYENPRERLPLNIKKYDKRFNILYNYFINRIKNKTARRKLIKAKKVWQESKRLLLQPPTKENAIKLDKKLKELIELLAAPKILKTKKSFKAISKTGHMCRIPLFMSNLYLMRLWGIDLPHYENQMKQYISSFRKDIKFLESYPQNSKEIMKNIKEASRNFIFFEMMYRTKKTAIPVLISKKADDIFYNIRTIKHLYGEKLLK